LFAVLIWLFAGLASAQTGMIQGKVLDEKGQPLQDALVLIERIDVRGNYKVKTKKKGEYLHAGLPLGRYKVTLTINGKEVDQVNGVQVGLDPTQVDFDLAKVAARQQQAEQAATSGQGLSEQQLRGMSAAERKKYEEALEKRREQMGKNKELNDTFNAGMQALQANNFPEAVTSLTRASEIDPAQPAVWANLAEAQNQLAQQRTGDERAQLFATAEASYQKAITLEPENARFYNNLGLLMVRAGKLDEGKQQLTRAAELDPANGGQYYFNLGAIMINTGNSEAATGAFQKAIELDPNYANAHYQLGTALVGSAEINADGSIKPVPGTIEAFQKYLELEPNGPMADAARTMIQTLAGSVDTKFESETKKKKK
jgi:tetratricopeptide (TPR) repeat protein